MMGSSQGLSRNSSPGFGQVSCPEVWLPKEPQLVSRLVLDEVRPPGEAGGGSGCRSAPRFDPNPQSIKVYLTLTVVCCYNARNKRVCLWFDLQATRASHETLSLWNYKSKHESVHLNLRHISGLFICHIFQLKNLLRWKMCAEVIS